MTGVECLFLSTIKTAVDLCHTNHTTHPRISSYYSSIYPWPPKPHGSAIILGTEYKMMSEADD